MQNFMIQMVGIGFMSGIIFSTIIGIIAFGIRFIIKQEKEERGNK